jgi:capsular exopolysaccharide synthesis family protein
VRGPLNPHLVTLVAPTSFEAEQYRTLRHALEQMHKTGALSIIGVASAAAQDGKTTTAINLAAALAEGAGTRVLLVDADLRRPAVEGYLGQADTDGSGLVDAIADARLGLADVARECPGTGFAVVRPGRCPSIPYEVLNAPRLGELLEEARQAYDYVVIDTPPLVLVPDGRLIARWVDGFLLVVGADRTPRRLVEEALNILDPPKLLGLVFNGDDRPLSGYHGSYYSYAPVRHDRASWLPRAAAAIGGLLPGRRPRSGPARPAPVSRGPAPIGDPRGLAGNGAAE